MKLLVVASSLDLTQPFSSTPSWWQLLKGLYELGVEVVAAPYQGPMIETLWWRAYPNPCQVEGDLFKSARGMLRRLGQHPAAPTSSETLSDRAARSLAHACIRPKWERHLSRFLERERDVDAVLFLTVPLNHLTGLPSTLKRHFGVPMVYYDGDVPASLPSSAGFATGFKIYQGADLGEYDLMLSNSKGGCEELRAMGARDVRTLYYAADPDVYSPLHLPQDIDVFFYGHTTEYRRDWLEVMVTQPSKALLDARFAVRGSGLDMDLGRAERLPYLSFSKLREYICRSKIVLNITRHAHASVHASSTARLFELAALGRCVVSNPVAGLEEWFEPGREMLVIHDAVEATETLRRLLADETTRRKMGCQAREQFLAAHTYLHRARELVEHISAIRPSIV
jgi:glycosyltransferase involved in cell wall biosynthesis